MSEVDLIDVEEKFMGTWNIIEDVKFIASILSDTDDFKDIPWKDVDKLQNMLIGIQTLYNYRFSELNNQFNEMIAEIYRLRKLKTADYVGIVDGGI